MKFIKSTELKELFSKLNKNKFEYILLRNINKEIPSHLKVGKDIDILINKKDEKKFIDFFHKNGFQTIRHPHKNNVFLYGVNKFRFEYNNNNYILFDFHFQIAVRSLDAGQWIPLDQIIQKSAWLNRRFEQQGEDFGYWTLSYEDEFVTLIARSVFDKKEFQNGYKNRINELSELIDRDDVMQKLNTVFFKFTSRLMELVTSKSYDSIFENYLAYKEY